MYITITGERDSGTWEKICPDDCMCIRHRHLYREGMFVDDSWWFPLQTTWCTPYSSPWLAEVYAESRMQQSVMCCTYSVQQAVRSIPCWYSVPRLIWKIPGLRAEPRLDQIWERMDGRQGPTPVPSWRAWSWVRVTGPDDGTQLGHSDLIVSVLVKLRLGCVLRIYIEANLLTTDPADVQM